RHAGLMTALRSGSSVARVSEARPGDLAMPGPGCASLTRATFPGLRAFAGFQQFLDRAEQLAERMRRLVALALVEGVAHQLAQLLAIGRRVRFDQLRQRGVAFPEQALAPAFGAVQQRGFLARGLAARVEGVADRVQRLVLLAPHLLGQERHLPLARDVRGDAPRV